MACCSPIRWSRSWMKLTRRAFQAPVSGLFRLKLPGVFEPTSSHPTTRSSCQRPRQADDHGRTIFM